MKKKHEIYSDLKKIKDLKKIIRMKEVQLADLKDFRIGAQRMTGIRTNGTESKVETLLLRVEKLQEEIDSDLDKLDYLYSYYIKLFKKLSYPHGDFMMMRYINGFSYPKIARILNYSEAHCFRLNRESINMIVNASF